MVVREAFAERMRAIQTRRREREQEIARASGEHQRGLEEARGALSTIDAELEEEIKRIRAAFEARRCRLEQAMRDAEGALDGLRAELRGARREQDVAIAEEVVQTAASGGELLTDREALLRRAAASRIRRERLLESKPDLARSFAEYEQVARFHESMQSGALPGPALDAVRVAIKAQLNQYRDQLRREGVPLEAESLPARSDLLLFLDVSPESGGAVPSLHVVTPCPYREYAEPRLDHPPLPLRVAAGVVRAVAEVQRALCTDEVPVHYRRAGDYLVVMGALCEDVVVTEASQMLEMEVTTAISNLPEVAAAAVQVEVLQLPPGVVRALLSPKELSDVVN